MTPLLLPVLSFSIILYEISLTRIFAYLLPYHHAGLAVSMAMLGLGLGSGLRIAFLGEPRPGLFSTGLFLMGVSYPAAAAFALTSSREAVLVAAAFIPFLAGGVLISACYAAWGVNRSFKSYSLDLLGASLACLLCLPLLDKIGPVGISLGLSGLCVAAALAALPYGRFPRCLMIAGLAAIFCIWGLPLEKEISRGLAHSALESSKRPAGQRQGRVIDWEWSPAGRADLYESPGLSSVRWIFNDGLSPTLLAAREFPDRSEVFSGLINSTPFHVRRPQSALLIGSGSGIEVLLAKHFAVETIVAVELSGAIIRLVRRWSSFAGPVYDQAGVELHEAEGRRFLEGDSRRHDLILMSFVLTGTQAAGAYAIVEGSLYTVEAYRLYLDRLTSDGMLALIDESEPRILRQFLTAVEALAERGVPFEEALKRLAVLSLSRPHSRDRKYMMFLSPSQFSADVLSGLREVARLRGYEKLWLPGSEPALPYSALSVLGVESFLSRFPLNVKPCRDDAPYFYNFIKGRAGHAYLMLPYLGVALLAMALAAGMAWSKRRDGISGQKRLLLAACLGAAFISAELGLLRRLSLPSGGPAQILSTLLFSILLWGALGGALAGYLTRRRGWGVSAFALTAAAALAAAVVWLRFSPLPFIRLSGISLWLVLAASLAPLGIAMGMPFPALLSSCSGERDDLARAWGINGLGSVAGAALSQVITLHWGMESALIAAAGYYLTAAWIARPGDGISP